MCKMLQMVKVGGFILSSNMLVLLSLDRYYSISRPLASLNSRSQRRRARYGKSSMRSTFLSLKPTHSG